ACLPYRRVEEGDIIAGTYRMLDLASGRFAIIDDALGFSLMPWTPSIERQLDHQVSGIATSREFRIKRSPSLNLTGSGSDDLVLTVLRPRGCQRALCEHL